MAEQWKEQQAIHQIKQQTGGVYNAFDENYIPHLKNYKYYEYE